MFEALARAWALDVQASRPAREEREALDAPGIGNATVGGARHSVGWPGRTGQFQALFEFEGHAADSEQLGDGKHAGGR